MNQNQDNTPRHNIRPYSTAIDEGDAFHSPF